MDTNKILQADVLDIIFEGRNKEYGAYDLRRTYNRRLVKALGVTASVIVLVCTGYYLSAMKGRDEVYKPPVNDVELASVEPVKKEEPIIPPAPKELPKQAMKIFTAPKIVPEDQVKPDEKPPEQDQLDEVKIGNVNQDGVKDDGMTAPPAGDGGKGIVEAPVKKDETDYDGTFMKVEKESEYPGGMQAWMRYMNKNFRYPDEAQNNEIQGTVLVQFIVDKEGNVSDVTAVSGPEAGGLREEAMRVIRKSGKWVPAIQNGRQVKSYKKQPIQFRIGE